jgi:hypothetical protein
MNRKQLISLVVIGAIVGVLWAITRSKEQKEYGDSSQRMGQLLMPNLPVNDITAVSFKQAKAELNLVKKNDIWVVKERGDYPANYSALRELLIRFGELKATKPVTAPQLAQLELLPPDKSPSTLVELKDANGKTIRSLLLGAKNTRESDPAYGGSSYANGRYVMVDNDEKKVSLINDPLASAEPKAEDWLKKDWFRVENLRSISVTSKNPTNSWKLSKDSETNEWKLADLKTGEQLDTAKLSQVTAALATPNFNDLATNSATGMEEAQVAKLETVDGFIYDVKIGNKVGESDYYMQVAVSGNFPKERTPGKDEKPEDKAKLDTQFKNNLAKLEEKLKNEKAFEKWTYVVSKWTIEPLLKERKELLAEKKEEAKPGETAPGMTPGEAPSPLQLPPIPMAPQPETK